LHIVVTLNRSRQIMIMMTAINLTGKLPKQAKYLVRI
jgi:hypothetical protein